MNPLHLLVWAVVAYLAVAVVVATVGLYLAWNELEPAHRYRYYRAALRSPVWPLGLIHGLSSLQADYRHSRAAAAQADQRSLLQRLDQLEVELDRQAELNERAAQAWEDLANRREQD